MSAALRLEGLAGGRLLVVGPAPSGLELPAGRRELEAPRSLASLRLALSEELGGGAFDAAVASGWGREVALAGLVSALRGAVRVEGRVALVAPVAREGWRGARGSLMGMLRGRRPLPLEELSGALLLGGCVDVRVRELDPRVGVCLLWARVPAGGGDDVGSSSIRAIGGGLP